MKPTRPETGYGYIEADLSVPSTANKEVFRVYSFKEKPDLETARRYIQKNNFLLECRYFCVECKYGGERPARISACHFEGVRAFASLLLYGQGAGND